MSKAIVMSVHSHSQLFHNSHFVPVPNYYDFKMLSDVKAYLKTLTNLFTNNQMMIVLIVKTVTFGWSILVFWGPVLATKCKLVDICTPYRYIVGIDIMPIITLTFFHVHVQLLITYSFLSCTEVVRESISILTVSKKLMYTGVREAETQRNWGKKCTRKAQYESLLRGTKPCQENIRERVAGNKLQGSLIANNITST